MIYFKNIKYNIVLKNIGANSFGVVVILFNQILMVPIFLSQWGVDKYGDWIVLTSLAGFLTMTDIGLNSVTANQYTISYAEGKTKECDSLLANNYFLLLVLSLFFIISSAIYLYFGNINGNFNVRVTDIKVTRIVLFILVLKVFITMFGTVVNAVYRAISLFSKSVFLDSIGRFFETILIFIGVVFNLDLIWIVLIMTFPSLALLIYKNYDTRKYLNYKISYKNLNFPLLKKTILPSFGFLAFPIGNAIILQGFTLVINNFMSSNVLILFNTTRTLINFIKQLVNVIAQSVYPELSIAFGKKDFESMRKLHRFSFVASTLLTIFASVAIMLLGKQIYQIWTHDKILFNSSLMFTFLMMLLANNGWFTSSVSLMATNKHSRLGIYYLILSFISLLLLYCLLIFYPKIELVPLCIFAIDFILTLYVLRKVLNLTHDTWNNFLTGSVNLIISNIISRLPKNHR